MSDTRVRLDRWLWAARFFRTRAQAKAAIEGGKVDYHLTPGEDATTVKPKVSKEVSIGDWLTVRRGWTAETIVVEGLSEQRGNAQAASLLYRETPESVERREAEVARRRMERAGLTVPSTRPSKRDRREIRKLKEGQEAS
ncbi:MAG: RNA-binding S4 domain-containing protein [Pseudomonadales bacterium]